MALFCIASPAQADEPDLRFSQMCTEQFARAEREQGIPKQLVQAIAMTESGRWSDEARTVVAWPWTINSGGKGYYFDTMHDAVTFARRLQLKGVESMDVGCMQVNLKHHPDAFKSLTDAFTPAKNVGYGAKFLRQNYDELGNWHEAIAAYHSRSSAKGRQYYANVRKNWQRALGGPMMYASDEVPVNGRYRDRDYASRSKASNRTFEISVRDDDGRSRRGRAEPRSAARESAGMKVIQVSQKDRQNSPEVLVVRPAVAEVEVASKNDGALESPFVARGSASVIQASATSQGASVKRISSRKSGPNFIFD